MKKLVISSAVFLLISAHQVHAAGSTTTYTNLGTGCGYASSSRAADSITTSCVGMSLADSVGGIAGTNLDLNWGVDLSTTGGAFSGGKLAVTLPDGRTLSCDNFAGSSVYPTASQIAPVALRTSPVYTFSLDGSCSGVDAASGKSFHISTRQDGNVRYQLIFSRRVGTKIIPGGVVYSLWDTGGTVTVTE